MVKIPLILRLKKESHKKIAAAQDLLVEELYKFFNNAVIHGGTAIWRCYNGKRFSEDIDCYIEKNLERLESLFKSIENKGFIVKKRKIGKNSVYSNLEFEGTLIRFEALFKRARGILVDYESVDGNFINIYSLSAEELLIEKKNAYLKRRKIRDLYDIYHLIKFAGDMKKIRPHLKELIKKFKGPVDEDDLRVIILEGVVPNADDLLNYIKRYA
jgi:predicted nucleotidyltransferase component of viral defense system